LIRNYGSRILISPIIISIYGGCDIETASEVLKSHIIQEIKIIGQGEPIGGRVKDGGKQPIPYLTGNKIFRNNVRCIDRRFGLGQWFDLSFLKLA
jgi:hypothetical protein